MSSIIFKAMMSMAIILELVMVNSLISGKEVKSKGNVMNKLGLSGTSVTANV